MNEIQCPKCGEIFQVDESVYASILKQVKTKEFNKELEKQANLLRSEKENAVAEAKLAYENKLLNLSAANEKELNMKEAKIHELELKINEIDKDITIAVNNAVQEYNDKLNEKDKKIIELQGQIDIAENEYKLREKNIQADYERKIKDKQEQIDYYKDLKARQSVKLLGESLEQHCEIEFNTLRSLGFQNAYFEKDNDIRTGSKGDYIYRDYDSDGVEFISIMFEMKNQSDTTSSKKKNR